MSAIFPSHQTIDEKSLLAADAEVAAAAESEDWRAPLDRVFRKHGRKIHRRAVSLAGKQGADDLVAETFCKLVSAYGRALNPRTPPATDDHMVRVVFTTLRNASTDAYDAWVDEGAVIVASANADWDAEGRTDDDDASAIADDDGEVAAPASAGLTDIDRAAIAAAASEADAEELSDLLDEALSTLPPMQDQVVANRGWHGDSREDVAFLLQVSVRTVDAHLQAGHASLRDYLLDQVPWLESDRLAQMILHLATRHAAKCDARRTRRECRALMAA